MDDCLKCGTPSEPGVNTSPSSVSSATIVANCTEYIFMVCRRKAAGTHIRSKRGTRNVCQSTTYCKIVSLHCKDRVIPFFVSYFLDKKNPKKQHEGRRDQERQGIGHVLGGDSTLSFLVSVAVSVGCAVGYDGQGQQLPTLWVRGGPR